MVDNKIITNIMPFNDVYINCYYSSLLPVIIAFGKSILSFLINDCVFLKYDNTRKNIRAQIHNIIPEEDLFLEQGIQRKKDFVNKEKILQSIKESLKNDSPVIVLIDTFFQKINYNTYKKHHELHYLLIVGFDEGKHELRINEHKYQESKKYELFNWKYDEFLIAYLEAEKRKDNNEFSNLQLKNENICKVDESIFVERYMDFIRYNRNQVIENLCCIKENIFYFFEDYQNLQFQLDKYRKHKKALLYVFKRLAIEDIELEEAINLLEKIWGLVTKASLSKDISLKLKNKIEELFLLFLEKDILLYERLSEKEI